MISSICVIGAGTMGSGIAQVAAQNGLPAILFDVNPVILDKARQAIHQSLQTLVSKAKLTAEESTAVARRIHYTTIINDCRADVVVEAIVEVLEAKCKIFQALAEVNDAATIFASNTSSLSINAIQQQVPHPARVAGLHFFNPATLMKLVEVVRGLQTSEATMQALTALCQRLNKVAVVCKDAPGFIVNRVARHYYLEAMKLVEDGVATIENVDQILEASGFKMGPFKLMDLIGMDVNLAVTQSLYDAFDGAVRFQPAALQVNKVAAGELGRKTGKGFYSY